VSSCVNADFLQFNVYWEGKPLGTYAGTTYAQSNWLAVGFGTVQDGVNVERAGRVFDEADAVVADA
jgi:hypothetical protein